MQNAAAIKLQAATRGRTMRKFWRMGVVESSDGSSGGADGDSGAKKAKSNRFALVSVDPEADATNRERAVRMTDDGQDTDTDTDADLAAKRKAKSRQHARQQQQQLQLPKRPESAYLPGSAPPGGRRLVRPNKVRRTREITRIE